MSQSVRAIWIRRLSPSSLCAYFLVGDQMTEVDMEFNIQNRKQFVEAKISMAIGVPVEITIPVFDASFSICFKGDDGGIVQDIKTFFNGLVRSVSHIYDDELGDTFVYVTLRESK